MLDRPADENPEPGEASPMKGEWMISTCWLICVHMKVKGEQS